MSILARDKVPPKTVKANINIPHCRGIPTKLPNQSHSRVVSKRLYKQKGEERRKEGKTGGGTEKKKKRRRRRGKCPPTEQRSAASSTVQGESSAKRGKGTKKELPRVGKQAPGFVCPRIFHRVLRTRWKRIHVCICTKGEERVETYEWYYALLHAVDPIALSSPPENRTPVVTPSVLLILPFHGLDDVYRSLRRRFHTSDTFWMTSKILRIFVYSYTVIEEWHLQQRYEEIIYSWWFRKFRNAGVQMKGTNRCFLSTFVCRNKKFKKD